MTLYFDCETFSQTPISAGTYRYLTGCEVLIVTYAIDDGDVQCWDVASGAPMPGDLRFVLEFLDDPVIAHNAMFDRNVLRLSSNMRVDVPMERWRCNMVRAYAHSLPGSLDALCRAYGLPQDQAKSDGKKYIQLFTKPHAKPTFKKQPLAPLGDGTWRATAQTHPEDWAGFLDYAKRDVSSMRELWRMMPSWNYEGEELAHWHRDQRAADRGFAVDLALATQAVALAGRKQAQLQENVRTRTDGTVRSATQRDMLLTYMLESYGVMLPDLQRATLARRIEDQSLPVELRELLAIRLQATTTSTSKYSALLRSHVRGRLHGTMQFNGASRTGRVAHRLFQPGNMPRPTMSADEIELTVDAVVHGYVDAIHDDVMGSLSNCIRGSIVASPGKKLVVADLANIEGRAAAWIAGEEWKLQAFREYDNGMGADLYKIAYARSFDCSPDFDHHTPEGYLRRQIGKVQELMLQYQGGVGAFLTGAATYQIDLAALAVAAWPTIPDDTIDESTRFREWAQSKKLNMFGLPERVYIVCDAIKRMWRAAHPAIASIWGEIEDAIRMAMTSEHEHRCRNLIFRRHGDWLRMILPSGRSVCYPQLRVDEKISYMGMDQYTRKWSRITSYGGKFFENACQAFARDVLLHGVALADDDGYAYVLSVHDEDITETPDDPRYTAEGLCRHLAVVPRWAPGLPLSAAGFEARRYRKD